MTNFFNNSTVKSIIIILIITALVLIPAGNVSADDGSGSEPSGSSSSCPGGSDGGSSNASAESSSASSSGAASSSGSSSTSSGSTAGSSSSGGSTSTSTTSSSSGSTGSGSSLGSTSNSAGSSGSTDSSGASGSSSAGSAETSGNGSTSGFADSSSATSTAASSGESDTAADSSDTANSAGSDSTAGSSSSGSFEQDSGATGSDSSTISAETSTAAGSGEATGSEDFTVSSSSASDSGSDNISADPETESPGSSVDSSSSPDNPGSDPVISEQDSIQHEDSADHEALSTETSAPETGDSGNDSSTNREAKQGNSYVATLQSDGEPLDAATPKEFTITFTEVGSDQIGSATIDVPDGWTLDDVSTVVASNGHSWIPSFTENKITITANDPAQLVGFGESVAVTFTATVADAGHNEVYEFETIAWTDNDPTLGNVNNMAAGYRNPVFIVGTGVGARAELEGIATDATTLNGIYVLTANIDLSSDPLWTPIGDDSAPFTGAFHGAGFTISGLNVSHGADNAGLFGVTDSAILHHVWLVDVGTVEASSGNNVGAIAGQMRHGSQLINSYAAGDFEVYGEENVGGLVGLLSDSTIVNSYSNLDVAAYDTDAGGLVGSAETDSIISDSYARGDVDGGSGNAGGLVGNLNANSVIYRSYSTGAVIGGTGTTGGLVGSREVNAIVYGSFYDSQTSGQSDDDGRGHPRTTVELQTLSHYTGYTIPWTMAGYNGAYPVLYWQPESGLDSSSSIWYMPGNPGGPTPPGLIPIHGGGGYNNSDPRWSPCTTFSSSAYTRTGYRPFKYLKPVAEADIKPRALPPTGGTSHGLWAVLIWLAAGFLALSFSQIAALPGTARIRVHRPWYGKH